MEMVIKEFSREIVNNGESSALFYQSFNNLVKGRFFEAGIFFSEFVKTIV